MQKLDRSGSGSSVAGSAGTPVFNSTGLTLPTVPILGALPAVSPITPLVPALAGHGGSGLQVPIATLPTVDTVGVPSECLLLNDMFDPNDETEPDFELDIKEDVQNVCLKFGKLKHIFVDNIYDYRNSAGFMYLRFENTQGAVAAQRALHGRWFAGKIITATYMVPQAYEAKFPDSK
ncbi:RNA-binding protein 39-like [Quercus lobata]|uniref:RNA-binding protein 39-like n=1 Tax=Quercus lobata TaxID=97700 RepID=UPI0012454AE2|nr:RNA-binding protein 39-like [Quercus lobata]